MSEFPLDPVLAKVVLSASLNYSCAQEALAIVAMLNVPNVFVRPRDSANAADDAKKKFAHNDGDHLTLLNVFNSFKKQNMDADWCWKNFLNCRALK
jgi:pre-mRNA-splicing factor ATP-dependent RNA helicase DHX15/PRP43